MDLKIRIDAVSRDGSPRSDEKGQRRSPTGSTQPLPPTGTLPADVALLALGSGAETRFHRAAARSHPAARRCWWIRRFGSFSRVHLRLSPVTYRSQWEALNTSAPSATSLLNYNFLNNMCANGRTSRSTTSTHNTPNNISRVVCSMHNNPTTLTQTPPTLQRHWHEQHPLKQP